MEAVLFTDFIKLEAKPWQNVAEVHSLVSAACRLKFREIVETVTISKDCVSGILRKRKPSEGWGARFLTRKPWDHFSQLSCIWWCCLSAIRRSLSIALWPPTKHEFISTHQSPRNDWDSGFHLTNLLGTKQSLSYWLERKWLPFFEIQKMWDTSIGPRKEQNGHGPLICRIIGLNQPNCNKKTALQKSHARFPDHYPFM